jgi:hypothetical protein
MRDALHTITALDQRASATITYGVPVAGVKATATVTVVDYLKAIATKAAGSITYGTPTAGVKASKTMTVVDWTVFASVKAVASITYGTPTAAEFASQTITYGAPNNGDTVVVNGTTFSKAAAGSSTQFSTIGELTALIEAMALFTATDNGTVITVKAAARGTAGNAYTLAVGGGNTGTMAVGGATLSGGVNGDTVTVNGTVLTCVASAPAALEFSSIAELEVLTEAISGIDSTQNGTVVSLVAATAGTAGNSLTLSRAGAGSMTVSGATFTGGKEAETITVNGTVLTANVDFTAETSNDATATNLAVAVAALANITASAVTNVVTVTADNEGTAGNAYTLATSNVAAATVAGATLTGGVNGDTVVVNGTTCTCVASSAGANEFTNITELEALVEAVALIDSSQNGTVVSILAATAGAAGNSLTLALGGSNTGTMAISGATLTGGYDNLTITFAGTALVQGTDFTAETSNAVTATNLAVAIAALANVTASALSSVVTITADNEGTTANAYTLTTSSAPAATVSGATMSGGVNGDTVVLQGTTFTCVASSAGAQEFTNITELEALCEAVAGFDSTQNGTVVTIYWNTAGTAGNAKTLALGGSNAGTMAISGATFSGGSDASYSTSVVLYGDEAEVEMTVQIDTLDGSSPTVDVTPQVSADNVNWLDAVTEAGVAITFAQFTATGTKTKYIKLAGAYMRAKIVLGGTANPVATGKIISVVKKR